MVRAMKLACAPILLVSVLALAARAEPQPAATIFAPGEVSGPGNDGAPTFTPDGHTLYLDQSNGRWATIVEQHLVSGHWSKPVQASFVDPAASEQQPALSLDGRSLVYASARLAPGGAKIAHLWRVERTPEGWSQPVELPPEVNISARVFKPSLAANGDLYFMSDAGPGAPSAPKWRLYRSAFVGGAWRKAEPLPFSDGTYGDVDPGVAPDGSFLVFSSKGRKPMDDDHEHLFIVLRKGDGWSAPTPVRYDGDVSGQDDGEAQVSRDGRTLYFTSGRVLPFDRARNRARMAEDFKRMQSWDNGNNNVWTLPLAPYLKPGAPS